MNWIAAAGGGDVGAGFVDHADNAKRGGDALDMQAVRAVPFGQDATDRVLLLGDLAQRVNDPAQAGVVQAQAVSHGGRDAALVGRIEVQRVGVEDFLPAAPDGIGGGDEGCGLAFRGGAGKFRRRGAGLGADVRHQVGELAVHCLAPLRPGTKILE